MNFQKHILRHRLTLQEMLYYAALVYTLSQFVTRNQTAMTAISGLII